MPNSDSLFATNDQLLWQQFRKGDTVALGQLSKKYYRSLFNYATRFTRDTMLIEDCIQDMFLKLWERRGFVGDTQSVKFYLLKTLRHQLIKHHQHQLPEDAWDESNEQADEETIESQLISQENWSSTTQQLNNRLSALPKRQREALYLRYYENLSYEQIAQTMNINAQSVANLLQNSLRRLRDLWTYVLWLFLLQF
ncbi:RNA polymerase sigma factor [Spirosoma sp. KUDC1026]|uniref:RNA polymerase sigma factor n=1 Tax=Spirosoma sp. KUDC1026 TaxID=2745947 RepID=UPI00159BB76F|nr:sigma-70 family RNA polymerase sigma factor [Spirosoma sp. KUDC1026]QKZ11213.1 sigma-70 family RNA polymerase sigma factor [Spirosoma sp. KUDC1026]